MYAEWQRCPRCKNQALKPELMFTEQNGSTKYWWVCENSAVCDFPLEMPPSIYHVTQTPYEKSRGVIPRPKILSLPERYHYLYPTTFACSRPLSRCSSVMSNPASANSRNETTIESSEGTPSEKSSGQGRLKADSDHSGGQVNPGNTPSTSAVPSEPADSDNIDEDVEDAAASKATCRTVQRKRPHDQKKSWAALIKRVSADPVMEDRLFNIEESELMHRMKEFFDDQYVQKTPIAYKRPAIRVTYRLEDIETCLRTVTSEEWKSARKRLPNLSADEKIALKTSNAEELLKSVGIDLQEKKKAVSEKVGKVMKGFSAENVTKRRKMDEERKAFEKQKEESRQNTIHLSVSQRILNKRMQRDEAERSLSSTPASMIEDVQPMNPQDQISQQHTHSVQFQLGNPEEVLNLEENPNQDYQDQEHHWGFDFDGLYESYHAGTSASHDHDDPVDSILAQLDEHPSSSYDHQSTDLQTNEGTSEQEQVEFTGFEDSHDGDFGGGDSSTNFDFVQDNFGF